MTDQAIAGPSRTTRIVYFVSTGLLTVMMLLSAAMYLTSTAEIRELFTALGYPTHLVYPLAIAKILGLIAIWAKRWPLLTDVAYAGFFYDFILAFGAHMAAEDPSLGPLIAMALLLTSYITYRKAYSV